MNFIGPPLVVGNTAESITGISGTAESVIHLCRPLSHCDWCQWCLTRVKVTSAQSSGPDLKSGAENHKSSQELKTTWYFDHMICSDFPGFYLEFLK
jgi:hypothetical protein